MKFGLFSMNMDVASYPESSARLARLAEAAGFESLWAGEHVVLPDPRIPPSPMEPGDRILDPIVALTYLAAHTERVKLGTGIVILPQRNPLVLAKEVASLDELSAGRVIFGIGAGYLEPEFRALGIPFRERGARTDEYLAAMRVIWRQKQPRYDGKFVAFSGVQAHPQRPDIPIVIGGHSTAAYRRAVGAAEGWYGFALDIPQAQRALAELAAVAATQARPAELGRLEISVTPATRINLDTARHFAELGVDRLILRPPATQDEDELAAFVTETAESIIGRI